MTQKTVGELREEERYRGNPNPGGSQQARARKFIDESFTPDKTYMDEAVKDTAETMRKSAQAKTDEQATVATYKRLANSKQKPSDRFKKQSDSKSGVMKK